MCYEHLKRFRQRENGHTLLWPNPKHLDYAVKLLGLEQAKPAPTPGVHGHRKLLYTTPVLNESETWKFRSALGAVHYYVLDLPHGQLEVNLCGRFMHCLLYTSPSPRDRG